MVLVGLNCYTCKTRTSWGVLVCVICILNLYSFLI
uniref:Uncharacterized protein n=1 Tax=Arundo donax TaxID=35708 RepID=A0A0A8YA40_ARUDO